jgi:alginate O-acetyltransferase complex protein AlgI
VTFSSLPFAVFLACLLLAIAIVPGQRGRLRVLLVAGAVFYGWWNWKFLALLGFTSVFDFFIGLKIGAATGARRKQLLVLDVCVNLGILVVFKYLNFFIDSANVIFGSHAKTFAIILPVGISFFVFEAMSYCIDIYRGVIKPYSDWEQFALFIFFFPRMIAGPIIRAADFLPQVRDRAIQITAANANRAACIFLLGLVKKTVIADRLALFVDPVFANPAKFDGATVWAAVIAYAIQIFCDFSGYTDMAIALAKLFNFDLPINFNLPYLSTNITEFWRRWHISLSSWLRDYLYISLGGNRKGHLRTYCNLIVTMLLGGLWHGASWNFVVWGGLHGVALALHKALGRGERTRNPVAAVASGLATFAFVCVCWVFFRAHSFTLAWTMLGKMATFAATGVLWIYVPFWPLALAMVVWHVARRRDNEHGELPLMTTRGWLVLWTVFYLVLLAVPTKSQPFIYFQF